MSEMLNLGDKSTVSEFETGNNDASNINVEYDKLKLENENFQQELHELRLKFENNLFMQNEIQEINESLKQSLIEHKTEADRIIYYKDKNLRATKEEYEKRLYDLESELLQIKVENVLLNKSKEQNEATAPPDISNQHVTNEDDILPLTTYTKELEARLKSEENKLKQAEETILNLNNEILELQNILQTTKVHLTESKEALKNSREELHLAHAEIKELKTVPVSHSNKGNSLFAEVEDQYQMLLQRHTALLNKYQEKKLAHDVTIAENKTLKAERITLLKECKDCSFEGDDLIHKYKLRIQELQEKLNLEMKKRNESAEQQTGSFNFLESLLVEKRKEIENLEQKLENNSIQALIQEEIKHMIVKELRHWRCETMSMKAHILTIEDKLGDDLEKYKIQKLSGISKKCSVPKESRACNFY